jgi:hypothetical protein
MALAEDSKSEKLLKVCSNCGTPLGKWSSEAERDAELGIFEEEFKSTGSPKRQ